ncbi:MAG: hypothetical protein HUU37_00295 [Bdellovibrionales bacterium]|nr:hypothetical protein [Bdellovibrionales bacterium]
MKSRFVWTLTVLLTTQLLPRLTGLGGPGLDNDELATALWAQSPSLHELYLQLHSPDEGNTLGYGIFMRVWALWSMSESWLRLPSALAGAFLPTAFFVAVIRLWRVSTVWAFGLAMILGSSELLFGASRTARCYSLFSLATFLAWWSAHCLVHRGFSKSAGAAWLASATAAIWLHHFGLPYVGTLALFGIYRSRSRAWLWFLPLLSFLPHVPLTLYQLQHGPIYLAKISSPQLHALFHAVFRWPPSEWIGWLVFLGCTAGWIFRRTGREALIAAMAAPAVGIFWSIAFKPVLMERYVAPSLPLFFLGAAGIPLAPRILLGARNKMGFATRLLGPALIFFSLWITQETIQRSRAAQTVDFREAAAWLARNEHGCGNKVVTHPGLVTKWRYYMPPHFQLLSWWERPLPAPVWLATGHYPLPPLYSPLTENTRGLVRRGRGTIAVCLNAASVRALDPAPDGARGSR